MKINRNEWMSFLLTLIATLVGVLIAIWLTNSSIRNKEKEDTVKLLSTAKIVLINTKKYSEILNNSERKKINSSKQNAYVCLFKF